MIDIEFSVIGEIAPATQAAVRSFEQQSGVRVKVRTMQWEYALPELLSYAVRGHGPDLSHVGSTWVSSLVKMNALRAFRPDEVQAVGGASAFLPSCWESVVVPGDETIWALPWTSFTFLLCYRRDLLARLGMDEASAFVSADALNQTLSRLQAAKVAVPWVVPSGRPHVDTIHLVASWIWGAGGDFVAEDGCTPIFTRPEALAGVRAYYELNEYLPRLVRNLTPEQVVALFRQGEAAVTICAVDEPYAILRGEEGTNEVRENLGVAPMPGQSWMGGDNLVIWQHTRSDPKREAATVALARHLSGRGAQTEYCRSETFGAPTRLDTLGDLPLAGTAVTDQVGKALREGRAYPSIPFWGRLETQLSLALNNIWLDIFGGMPVAKAVRHQLEPAAEYLATILK